MCQGIPDIPVAVQEDCLNVSISQNSLLEILGLKPLRIIPFEFLGKIDCALIVRSQDGYVAVVGDHSVDDDDDILSVGANGDVLHHDSVVFVIPAKDGLFKSFHADVKGLNAFYGSGREFSRDNSFHDYDSFLWG